MRSFPTFAVVIMLIVTGIAGFVAGMAHGRKQPAVTAVTDTISRKEKHDIMASFPEVKDALARYRAQEGSAFERSMESRDIQIMVLADRVCVQFELDIGSMGGTPVWCYAGDAITAGRPRQLQLVYDGSRVE